MSSELYTIPNLPEKVWLELTSTAPLTTIPIGADLEIKIAGGICAYQYARGMSAAGANPLVTCHGNSILKEIGIV